MFFAEQERKWANLTVKIKEKVDYYKDLCKTILDNKNKKESKLDRLKEILMQNKLTETNLNNHKTIIYNFIDLLKEKRDDIYLRKADVEIMTKELNLFVHGFDILKLDKNIRDKIKEIDWKNLYNNITKVYYQYIGVTKSAKVYL